MLYEVITPKFVLSGVATSRTSSGARGTLSPGLLSTRRRGKRRTAPGDCREPTVARFRTSRITSYNVCYTKLLRVFSSKYRIALRTEAQISSGWCSTHVFHSDHLRREPDAIIVFYKDLAWAKFALEIIARITSYNVCYTKLLRGSTATTSPPIS